MEFTGAAVPLSQAGLDRANALLGTTPPDLWAVLSVETDGCGYLANRRPLILFERHVFHRGTRGAYDASYPTISSSVPGGYEGGSAEYARLAEAYALDPHQALLSTSWGIGQVMGYNWQLAGHPSVEAMVSAIVNSEDAQLQATATYLKARNLHDPLARHDWRAFARAYNGPDFAKNQYDSRLVAAYQSFVHGPLPDLRVRQAQVLLMFLGIDTGGVDGVLGKRTRSGLSRFRDLHGLPSSDAVDDVVVAALITAVSAPAPT